MIDDDGIIVAGTGHRPEKLGGYSAAAGAKINSVIAPWLAKIKPKRTIAGGALGFDQELMKVSIDLNIPLTLAMPFRGQEANWPTAARVIYKMLVEKCDEVIVVCEGTYAAYKMQKRNEWMVRRITSDRAKPILLTIHNGTEGGTKNCLDYAKTYVNLEIVNLYDKWAAI